MSETLHNLYIGFSVALAPSVLLYAFVGCVVGTLVGVLPGIGPLAGISLLLPASFGLDATSAIVLLAGIYYGAMYGGSTTSILMRIPGEAASVMTCIDGYEMTRQGRAGPALAIAAIGSYIAGTVSIVGLMLLAPPLASFALRFGPPGVFRPPAAGSSGARLHEQRLHAQVTRHGSAGTSPRHDRHRSYDRLFSF